MWCFHISYCTPLYGYAPEHIPKASIFTCIHWFLIVWRNTFHAIVLVSAIFTFRQIHVLFPMRIRVFTRLYPYATIYQSRIIRSGCPVGSDCRSLRHFLRCHLGGIRVYYFVSSFSSYFHRNAYLFFWAFSAFSSFWTSSSNHLTDPPLMYLRSISFSWIKIAAMVCLCRYICW